MRVSVDVKPVRAFVVTNNFLNNIHSFGRLFQLYLNSMFLKKSNLRLSRNCMSI